jgi:acyl-CoA dehydrogenase
MGEEGLLGLNLPLSYGGLGYRQPLVTAAGETLVRRGHNMGIGLSWLMHILVSHFLIMRFGSKAQREKYLHGLSKGKITAAFAISEPEAGTHPKYLKTSATRRGDFYALHGEKHCITNGPIADLFVVIAITGVDAGMNRFSAFLVPGDTPGLSPASGKRLDFLRPSPHCGIRLDHCLIPASAILGAKDTAYEKMVKPFRILEDIYLMGMTVGGMERQMELALNAVRKKGVIPSDEIKGRFGGLRSLLDSLEMLAYRAARFSATDVPRPELLSLSLSFRSLSDHFQMLFEQLLGEAKIEKDSSLRHLTSDLVCTNGIARRATLANRRKLGDSLL